MGMMNGTEEMTLRSDNTKSASNLIFGLWMKIWSVLIKAFRPKHLTIDPS